MQGGQKKLLKKPQDRGEADQWPVGSLEALNCPHLLSSLENLAGQRGKEFYWAWGSLIGQEAHHAC